MDFWAFSLKQLFASPNLGLSLGDGISKPMFLSTALSASNPRPSPHSIASGVHALVGQPSQESPPLTSQKPG
jgi:hypothetical protein